MLSSNYQQFIHLSRYARWRDELGRRENWDETVARYFDFFVPHLNDNHGMNLTTSPVGRGDRAPDAIELQQAIGDLRVLPSMRCLMTAGKALARDHVAGYNCAYRPVDDI